MNLLDYPSPTPSLPPVPWPDRLSRSLLSFPNRLNTIALSPSGQIAIAISPALSILHPSLLFRISASSIPPTHPDPNSPSTSPNSDPLELPDPDWRELTTLDPNIKRARNMRPQGIAHHFACRLSPKSTVRKDQETGIADLVAVTWTPWLRGGCVLVTGEGVVLWAVERWHLEGGWGGVNGDGWTVVPVSVPHDDGPNHPAVEHGLAVEKDNRSREAGQREGKVLGPIGDGSCGTAGRKQIADAGKCAGVGDGTNDADQQGAGGVERVLTTQHNSEGDDSPLDGGRVIAERDKSRAVTKVEDQKPVRTRGNARRSTTVSDRHVAGVTEGDREKNADAGRLHRRLSRGHDRLGNGGLSPDESGGRNKRRASGSMETRKKPRAVCKRRAMSSVLQKDPVLRVEFTKVWKCGGQDDELVDYAVFARQKSVCMYAVDTSTGLDKLRSPLLVLYKGWSAAISCLVGVPWGDKTITLIAVGGQSGELQVYGVWLDGNELTQTVLWREESSLLFGPVSSMCWGFRPPLGDHVRLVIGCGETLAIVDWRNLYGGGGVEGDWGNPEFHRVSEAHDRLVSCVQVLVDGSLMSAGLDGELYLWRLEEEESGEGEPVRNISCERVRKSDGEPIMAMKRSINGFGVVTLTRLDRGTDQHDEDDSMREKNGQTHHSMLGLYVQPPSYDLEEVTQLLASTVEALATSATNIGEAISLWDLELFMEQFDAGEEEVVVSALQEQVNAMLKRMQTEDRGAWKRREFEHYLRVAYALCRLIQKGGYAGGGTLEEIEGVCRDLCAATWSIHYEACILSMFRTTEVGKLSLEECRALQLMCEFIEGTSHQLLWDWRESRRRVDRVREDLRQWEGKGDVWATPCPVCIGEIFLPLATQVEDATAFYCPAGDCFGRCVLTGLPCTDVVPLVCYGCEAKALLSVFAGNGGNKFGWVVEVGICPVCKGKLVPSSVELQ